MRNRIAEGTGVALPKATLSGLIEKLEKLSTLRDYEFLDAVYREASKKLRAPSSR